MIAGQGTIGMEILKARNGRALDIVFCCCGGGGLVAGVAAYIKQVRPEVKVGIFFRVAGVVLLIICVFFFFCIRELS